MRQTLRIAGHDIAVTTLGQGKRDLVMIHCSLGSHRALARVAALLADEATIRLIDMPGHGDSGPWDGTSDIQQVVAEAAAAVTAAGATVFGHSFGGLSALRMAVERPDLSPTLVLYEPVAFPTVIGTADYDAYLGRFQPMLDAWEAGDLPRATEIFNGLWGARRWAELPERVRQDMTARIWFIPATRTGYEADAGGVFADGRLEPLGPRVTLLEGGVSEPVMAPVMAALERRLPGCRRVRFDMAGHMGPITHPGAVAAAIRQAWSA